MLDRRLLLPIVLSIAAALVTLGLKTTAWLLTGSVGLFSDAAESLVNLAAAVTAFLSLRYSARPVDASHTYGHEKIEYFSSGLEGGLVLVAAVTIGYYAVVRLIWPSPPEQLGLGMTLSLIAAAINGAVAWNLLRVGRRHGSIVLEADGQHLMTDVWTSVAVLAGLAVIWLGGWAVLDPLIALAVAVNVLWTGADLMHRSFDGLMDHSLPEAGLAKVRSAIEANLGPRMDYHAVRSRQAGARRFLDFHLLVPGLMSVRESHDLMRRIETAVRTALPGLEVTIHAEPIEDRTAYEDSPLLALEEAARRERAAVEGGRSGKAGENER
jgi:cation diffusion facilitator family transporter